MGFGYGIRSAPCKQFGACSRQGSINTRIVAIVGFLVHNLAREAKNPRLDISLRNQVNDRLVIAAIRKAAVSQFIGELR
jgi:hypothetical protein